MGSSSSAGKSWFELAGRPAGALAGFEGANDGRDLTLRCGAGMSRAFYGVLTPAFSNSTSPRLDGAVHTISSGGSAGAGGQRLEFFDAVVSEVALPALDRSTKSAAWMTVKLAPEIVKSISMKSPVRLSSKPWFVSDFKLKIDGLVSECGHVTGVGSVSVKKGIIAERRGADRFASKVVTSTKLGDLVITLPGPGMPGSETAASGFNKWLRDSVATGSYAPPRAGSLEYLAFGGGTAYFRLDFSGLQISSISTGNRKTHVTMFYSSASFSALPAAFGR